VADTLEASLVGGDERSLGGKSTLAPLRAATFLSIV